MEGKLVKDNKCLADIDLEEFKGEILKLAFPIGSSYITQTDVNPLTILGFGTWERIKGKILVGVNEEDENFDEIGKTGGSTTHTLTQEELPNYDLKVIDPGHKHTAGGYCYTTDYGNTPNLCGSGTGGYYLTTDTAKTRITVNSDGGDEEFNIMNPYEVVGYMWKRTA